jgi:hypothetical protein
LGLRIWGLGLRVWSLVLGVKGSEFGGNSSVAYIEIQNRSLEYGEPRCGFNTKHQSTKGAKGLGVGGYQGRACSPSLSGTRPASWFRVQGSGFRVQGSGFRVQGVGRRVECVGVTSGLEEALTVMFQPSEVLNAAASDVNLRLGFGVWVLGLRFGVWGLVSGFWGLGFGVWGWGLGFGVWGLGFGVWGLGF